MDDLLARLGAPFPPEAVSWRVGSTNKKKFEAKQTDKRRGQPLCYVDARDVMQRLDDVCGAFGWQCEYVPMPNGTTCCRIGIKQPIGTMSADSLISATGEWIWKSNGAGATDVEGDKGAYSDAFKRAAVLWGIGQYLYSIKTPWVALNDWWQIPDDELPALHKLLGGQAPKTQSKRETRADFTTCETALRAAAKNGMTKLRTVWDEWEERIGHWPKDWQKNIYAERDRLKAELEQGAHA